MSGKAIRETLAALGVIASMVFVGLSSGLAAQAPVAVGERVRVSTESGATHVGPVIMATSGAIEVQDEEGGRPSVPLSTVTRLEVSRGQRSNLGVGLFAGAGAGALVGLAICADPSVCSVFDDNDVKGKVIAFSAGVGILAGAIVGHFIKTDRWEEVPLERLSVSLTPQRDGRLMLGFSVRF